MCAVVVATMLTFAAISPCQFTCLFHSTFLYTLGVFLPAIVSLLRLLLVVLALLYWRRSIRCFLSHPPTGLPPVINTDESHTVEQWLHEQKSIITFEFAGPTRTKQDQLALRASANRRVREAFDIENSLTTTVLDTHNSFLSMASQHINRRTRDWTRIYQIAKTFLEAEIATARLTSGQRPIIPLAECVQCACLTVVLFDNFVVTDPTSLPRQSLVTIASEINKQWLKSKSKSPGAEVLTKSALLNETISSLSLVVPCNESQSPHDAAGNLSPRYVLGVIMPQYETLWRVVLLAFVTAYHRQPNPSLAKRVENVPECLGNPAEEKEALKVAKAS